MEEVKERILVNTKLSAARPFFCLTHIPDYNPDNGLQAAPTLRKHNNANFLEESVACSQLLTKGKTVYFCLKISHCSGRHCRKRILKRVLLLPEVAFEVRQNIPYS